MAKKDISKKRNKCSPPNWVRGYKGKWQMKSWERSQSRKRPGKKSGTAWQIYFIDEKQTWTQGGGQGNNSHKVPISTHFPSLMIEHDFFNSRYKSPQN